MFKSEMASLEALEKTGTIRVPHPIGVVKGKNNAWHSVVEFLEIKSLSHFSEQAGKQIAELHLHNENVAKYDKNFEYIDKFGFPIRTCVGLYPVDNTWSDDWPVTTPSFQ